MSLENLAMLRYRYITEQKELKKKRAEELRSCEMEEYYWASQFNGGAITEDMKNLAESFQDLCDFNAYKGENCIGIVFNFLKEERKYDAHDSFDDLLLSYGCKHCNESRNLKRKIGELGAKIGQINGRITLIGNRLSQ